MQRVPKVRKDDVNTSISPTIDNASRITNVLKLTNTLGSTLLNVPSSSNSHADCATHPIHCTVWFGNDQFASILGHVDLVQGNIMIKRVYYVEGLNHNLFSVGQFCDADLENGIVKIRNRTLVEAARTMLSASKLPLFFWAEAIATACYTHSSLKTHDHNNEPSSSTLVPNVSPPTDTNSPSLQKLEFLYSPLFKEYSTASNQSVSKSFALSDNSKQQDTQPTENIQPTKKPITPTTNVNAEENNNDQAADA
ncbi:integrase, catalytic region, zinc finger, CCHC-type containing protein [Tanacetum coccineum]